MRALITLRVEVRHHEEDAPIPQHPRHLPMAGPSTHEARWDNPLTGTTPYPSPCSHTPRNREGRLNPNPHPNNAHPGPTSAQYARTSATPSAPLIMASTVAWPAIGVIS